MAFLDNQGVSKLCALLKDKFDNVMSAVNRKQDALTAGANITINNGVISAADTDTTYTAGTGINIDSNNEISCTVSGGASYIAGNGIDIDADGVIKTINNGFSSYGPNWILGNFYFNGSSVANYYVISTTNKDDFINCLKAGLFVQYKGADNITITGADIVPFPERQGMLQNCVYKANINGNGEITTANRIFNSQVFTFSNSNNIYVLCGNIIIGATDASYFCWMFRGIRFIATSGTGLTSTTINDAINEVATNLNTRIPTAPSSDGTYKLTSTISSGTPTYSWEANSGSSGGNVSLTYGEYGIPIGLFYNDTKGYQSPFYARTPAILQLSVAPSARELASGQFIKTYSINDSPTYNTADIFPDATANTCYKIQVKRDGIDWANAQTISTSVGATFDLTFYGRGTIRVGNVIFYWLSRDQWSSNSNSVYDEDALRMIREELFPELFTSSSSSSLPAAPSADGNYILKCSVSSGTPTYSWESVTVGGSY